MSAPRTLDVSSLPTEVFGHRSVTWFATVAFIVIEGTSLAIGLASYLYLRGNFNVWPPPTTPPPSLLWGTLSLIALLVAILPMYRASQAAKKGDVTTLRIALLLGVAVNVAALVFRGLEFGALGARWDQDAYSSAVWFILGAHTLLMLVDIVESSVIASIFFTDRVRPKHFIDVEDDALYQYFLSLAWVPGYVIVILLPRF